MVHASRMISSVQKAVDILNLFDGHTPELGMTEIAHSLNLHKSTAASLVYTLEANGYLIQNMKSRKYRLGFKLAERAAMMLNQIQIRQVAYPFLQALRDRVGETVNLAILDGAEVVYIERLAGADETGSNMEVGRRVLAHSSSLGKAILSALPEEDVNRYIQQYGLVALTPNTITVPAFFLMELEQTRERGFAIDNEENEPGGRCVATPIFNNIGQVIAAISISVNQGRLLVADFPVLGEQVRETAKAISRRLGYLPRAY